MVMGDPRTNAGGNVVENNPPSAAAAAAAAVGAEPVRRSLRVRRMSRQLSLSETPLDMAWERRRRRQGQSRKSEADQLTDEDLNELKGCIDLGFGFDEENGQRLCTTIPALDLYFAVNRVLATSPVSSPTSGASAPAPAPAPSPGPASTRGGGGNGGMGSRSLSGGFLNEADMLKICSPGDDPRHVKTKLRHWAQAVACSVKQSS